MRLTLQFSGNFSIWRWIKMGRCIVAALVALGSAGSLIAAVTLPPVLSDHMVLQRDKNVPIWGKGEPGEEVTVLFAGQTRTAKVDTQGRWKVALDLEKTGEGPFALEASAKSGKVLATDVLVGDVWVASGQSNMAYNLKRAIGAEIETALPVNAKFRYFTGARVGMAVPAEDLAGKWVIDGPETRPNFSAAAYFFAKTIQQSLNSPVGIVEISWGGSAAEAWTSLPAIRSNPGVLPTAEKRWKQDADYRANKDTFGPAFTRWLKETGREDKRVADPALFAGENSATTDWTPVKIPGVLKGKGLPDNGAVWVRTDITIEPDYIGKDFQCELGLIQNATTVYWNGTNVGEFTFGTYPGAGARHNITIKGELLKPGRNVLAVRYFAPLDPPQIDTKVPAVKFNNGVTQAVNGPWFAKAEYALPVLSEAQRAAAPVLLVGQPEPNRTASFLYNGMVHPLLPFALRGVIWYQGEDNSGRGYQYRTTFANLIRDWRTNWNRGDFPFYFCQVPNFGSKKAEPGDSNWAELREAQFLAQQLPNTGMAVLIDLGEANDIHPHAKRQVGERLAALALVRTYGKQGISSGPVYDSMTVEGGSIRVRFKPGTGPLAALPLPDFHVLQTATNKTAPLVRNSPRSMLEGFSLCGADGKWKWADAKIDGDTVVVSSDQVPKPAQVRYAWADNPTCNLGNAAGIPASPFRSDTFTELSRDRKY